MGLFGFGAKKEATSAATSAATKEPTLASLKARSRVGVTLTMLSNQLNGSDMLLPDPILRVPRPVIQVHPDGLLFDPRGPGGEQQKIFYWPLLGNEGFLVMQQYAIRLGVLREFLDIDTFLVDYQVNYCIFRLTT
ncbi:hypothetical protein GO300_03828 [Ralstonia solanacearum]|nr:hypothetical protein [Ralstonia solanacearum]